MHRPFCTLAIIGAGILAATAADKEPPKAPKPPAGVERLRFVPEGRAWKGESEFDGAAWTQLVQGPIPGELMLHARTGIGDKFPVSEDGKTTLFEVVLKDGNDEMLTLEVRSKGVVQKIELVRDNAVPVEVNGVKYRLSFPTQKVQAGPNELPSTNKATIIVSRKKAEK